MNTPEHVYRLWRIQLNLSTQVKSAQTLQTSYRSCAVTNDGRFAAKCTKRMRLSSITLLQREKCRPGLSSALVFVTENLPTATQKKSFKCDSNLLSVLLLRRWRRRLLAGPLHTLTASHHRSASVTTPPANTILLYTAENQAHGNHFSTGGQAQKSGFITCTLIFTPPWAHNRSYYLCYSVCDAGTWSPRFCSQTDDHCHYFDICPT